MSSISLDIRGHVARITINRPERMNAFDVDTHEAFAAAIDQIQTDDNIRVGIITGAGDRAFCAGRDLKWTASLSHSSAEDRDDVDRRMDAITPLTFRFDVTKPLIARVNGVAVGGGLELALACDIIVAADHAELGLPEPLRGLIAGGMGIHRLARQVPHKLAMGYLLTGRHFSATRAAEMGLVNEVVPTAELDRAVDEWVADIVRCSPASLRATKHATLHALHLALADAASHRSPSEVEWSTHPDRTEGPRAFAEKRAPRWA